MPTTTNYGWTTPADTDLVKDGASAIRTLGTAIDTTVFNNASAGIAKTIVDAKGDIIAATAADTVARLAVGTNDQVLIADSSTATGLKWGTPASGGGMTLLSTTNLSGTITTISSISGSYTNLLIIVQDPKVTGATGNLRIYPNGFSAGAISFAARAYNSSLGTSTNIQSGTAVPTVASNGSFLALINLYADSTYKKNYIAYGDCNPASGDDQVMQAGTVNLAAAITSIEVTTASQANSFNGGRVLIYGVK